MSAEIHQAFAEQSPQVELLSGAKGAFEVEWQGKLIFSRLNSGLFPEDGEIPRLLAANLPAK